MNGALDSLWRGIYRKGTDYKRGEFATHRGAMWHCNANSTQQVPGTGSDWTLAAKSGQPVSESADRRTEKTRQRDAILSRIAATADVDDAEDTLARELGGCGLDAANARLAAQELIEQRLPLIDAYLNAAEGEEKSAVASWVAGLPKNLHDIVTRRAASMQPRDVVNALLFTLSVDDDGTEDGAAELAHVQSVLARAKALAGYLACLGNHPDDPKRDAEAGAAFVSALPASLQKRFAAAFAVPWTSAAQSLRVLRSALFTPEEEAKHLPPLPQ